MKYYNIRLHINLGVELCHNRVWIGGIKIRFEKILLFTYIHINFYTRILLAAVHIVICMYLH